MSSKLLKLVAVLLMVWSNIGLGLVKVSARSVYQDRIEEVTYEIPIEWKRVKQEDIYYYYPKDGMVMVKFMETDFTMTNTRNRENFIEGMAKTGGQMSDEQEILIDNQIAYQYSFMFDSYKGNLTVFDSERGIIAFITVANTEKNVDYTTEFNQILSSISRSGKSNKTNQSGWNKATNTFVGKELTLTIDKTELTEDFEGKPALKIYYTLTNNGNKEQTVLIALGFVTKIQQKNRNTSNNLRYAILGFGASEEDHLQDNLLPGGTISGFYPVTLENTTDPVIIKFQEGFQTVAEHEIILQ